ncbi:hypothetical protein L914_08023 [Phytophthora nicotianae]|uniref:Uncharacterized protein n=1 Tax=Phytophthora nicotianae TaxID=4792 RepID=W2NFD0_PHYNI|nr:hypothetical protein L914_08023 [Phytophthora nicotianae]
MNLDGPSLSILSGSDMVSVKLLAPPRLIKVDPINYALQVGSSTADMLLNARELLRQQDTMCVTCRKRRGPLPASVTALLAVPFAPDKLVPLLLPHDLRVVHVRRQHILDVCLGPRKKSKLDLYKDPQAVITTPTGPIIAPSCSGTSVADGYFGSLSDSEVEDIRDVHHQNRPLVKRHRITKHGSHPYDDRLSDGADSYHGPRREKVLPVLARTYAAFGPRSVLAVSISSSEPLRLQLRDPRSNRHALTPCRCVDPGPRALVERKLHRHLRQEQFYNSNVVDLIDTTSDCIEAYKGTPDGDSTG